jgi:hypothetical protein
MRYMHIYIQQIQSQEQGKPRESIYGTRELKQKNDIKYPAPKAQKRDVAKTTM